MVKVSVIIPSLNEAKYIGTTLQNLKKQSFKDFEIIVADGGSTDKTREIAKKYARVIVVKRKGIGVGRNAGAKVAKGEVFVFLDADTKPSNDLLKTYYEKLNENVVAATGPIMPLEKVSIPMWLGFNIVSVFIVRFMMLVGKPSIIGSNFAVRKDVFRKIKGFDEHLVTYEDWDLSIKLKKQGKIAYLSKAKVYTSARRVLAWGITGYFAYHLGNTARYYATGKPKTDYPEIR